MQHRFLFGRLSMVFVILLLLLPIQGRTQGLPEGVSAVLISEYDINSTGIEKVRLMKLTMQPGAAWENVPVANMSLCHLTEGTYTVVNHDLGITNTFTPGSRWFNRKGWTISLYNRGDVPAVQWVYEVVGKE